MPFKTSMYPSLHSVSHFKVSFRSKENEHCQLQPGIPTFSLSHLKQFFASGVKYPL